MKIQASLLLTLSTCCSFAYASQFEKGIYAYGRPIGGTSYNSQDFSSLGFAGHYNIMSKTDFCQPNTAHYELIKKEDFDGKTFADGGCYSFDYERKNEIGDALEGVKQFVNKLEQLCNPAAYPNIRIQVYINPRVYFETGAVSDEYQRIPDILNRIGTRGEILIPTYPFMKKDQSIDDKEHGVNIKDVIKMATHLEKEKKTRYQFIIGAHGCDGRHRDETRKLIFEKRLNELKKQGSLLQSLREGRPFIYYGLYTLYDLNKEGQGGCYDITRKMLKKVQKVFHHL